MEVKIKLSARDAAFVYNVAILGMAPTRAAKEAGFSRGHAENLLRSERIQAAFKQTAHNAMVAVLMSGVAERDELKRMLDRIDREIGKPKAKPKRKAQKQ